MYDLDDLWRRRLSVVIENIVCGEREYREIAQAAEQIQIDYRGRFLFELLQNASDQALKATLPAARVTLVRGRDFVAAVNDGLPFDGAGLQSITSLALSSKDDDKTLGNKGLGFKSVFEVSDGPEIYSASALGGTFCDATATWFRFAKDPIQDPVMRGRLPGLLATLIESRDDWSQALSNLDREPLEFIMSELQFVAPFKLPLPSDLNRLNRRIEQLRIHGCVHTGETLIFLPLKEDGDVHKTVHDAFAELRSAWSQIMVFLPVITEINIVDAVHDHVTKLRRGASGSVRPSAHSDLVEIETSCQINSLAEPSTITQLLRRKWWCVSREMGGGPDECDRAESAAIEAAVATLTGEAWRNVKSAMVSVALPQMDTAGTSAGGLSPDGRFCIGLPTEEPTGTPFWVNGRFYAVISRTSVDFNITYNKLLLNEGVRLVSVLCENLKRSSNVAARRAVTLSMVCCDGPIATALYEPTGLAHQAVVLAANGRSYTRAAELSLPHPGDQDMFDRLSRAVPEFRVDLGFVLPDTVLLKRHRELLEWLGANTMRGRGDRRFTDPTRNGASVLEVAAKRLRKAGPTFWTRFFEWLLDRNFHYDVLKNQTILPTVDGGLAAATSKVFMRPARRISSDTTDELEDVHPEIGGLLRFLDEKQVPVRSRTGPALTELGRRLSPDGPGLVLRPRIEDLFNDALAPRLHEITEDATSNPRAQTIALALLAEGVKWIRDVDDRTLLRLKLDEMRVPVCDFAERWAWVKPTEAYFGQGWLDDPHREGLLASAYGDRQSSLLPPWTEFASRVGDLNQRDRDWWFKGLDRLGVARSPRIVSASRTYLFRAYSWSALSIDGTAQCPIPQAAPYWKDYADALRVRPVNTTSGQPFCVDAVEWLDGLEDDHRRRPLVELVLTDPQRYKAHLATTTERLDIPGRDAVAAATLWVHMLRGCESKAIPVNDDFAMSRKAWWLEEPQRRQEKFAFLQIVPARFRTARDILLAVGVETLDSADPTRLVDCLQDAAELIPQVSQQQLRHLRALVSDLYARLDERCRGTSLTCVLDRPMPLFRSGHLTAVALDGQILYVNDDPIRALHVPGFTSNGLSLPITQGRAQASLVSAVRDVLGQGSVVFTSQAEVDPGFIAASDRQAVRLFEYIESSYQGLSVITDLGVLLAYGGSRPLAVDGDEFKRLWNTLSQTILRFGTFDSGATSFFDSRAESGPILMVSRDFTPDAVLAALWSVAGHGYRDLFDAYVGAVNRSQTDGFFRDRQIGPDERSEVEEVLGQDSVGRFAPIRPALLAVWRVGHPHESLERFQAGLKRSAPSPTALANWLGMDDLARLLEDAREMGDGEGLTVRILTHAEISAETWHEAREMLGLSRGQFRESVRNFQGATRQLCAVLMTMVAQGAIPPTAQAETLVNTMLSAEAPAAVAQQLPDITVAIHAASRTALDALDAATLKAFSKYLRGLLGKTWGTLEELVPKRLPRPIFDDYADNLGDFEARTSAAEEVVDGLTRAAVALARRHRESLTVDAVMSDRRVAMFSRGLWANRFGVLAAMQVVIGEMAPRTARHLNSKSAFKRPHSVEDLWRVFKLPGAPSGGPPEPAKVTVMGVTKTLNELEQDLTRGRRGTLGKAIGQCVRIAVDVPMFRATPRAHVAAPPRGARNRSGWRPGSSRSPRNDLIGAIGEAFAFEYFRAHLTRFDEKNWVSSNRNAYGFTKSGNDDLGYDMKYYDRTGELAGRTTGMQCYIDVKATSDDGKHPFPMTRNEWNLAIECSSSMDAVYIIVRVSYVLTDPKITDMVFDPYALYRREQLDYRENDLILYVGSLT